MREDLEKKYRRYKGWLAERHLAETHWLRNRDLKNEAFHEFGKRDSLFYTTLYLAALALEQSYKEYISLLSGLNAAKQAPGIFPCYPGEFNTPQAPYYSLLLALMLGMMQFPYENLPRTVLAEIIRSMQENNYRLKNPDGARTTQRPMRAFKPMFRAIQRGQCTGNGFRLALAPALSLAISARRRGDDKNFLAACQHLVYHMFEMTPSARAALRWSASRLCRRANRKNPFFLMVRDLVRGTREHLAPVEKMLYAFPDDHLPNDLDRITHSDMLWMRDLPARASSPEKPEREYTGVDFMILYQYYRRYYIGGATLRFEAV